MARNYEICGAKKSKYDGWTTCHRKKGHTGEHADTKRYPYTYWRDAPVTEIPTQPTARAIPKTRLT